MNILVVEDERTIAALVRRGLESEGYVVDVAYDGEQGLVLAETNDYDLIVLDVMLPKANGFSVCRTLRGDGKGMPILMLTARDGIADRVNGLDRGADDYLTKPFAFEELFARVRALLRRHDQKSQPVMRVADLTMDPSSHTVRRAGQEVDLTPLEYRLLEYLMFNVGRALSRTLIEEHVWGSGFDSFSNAVDVYVAKLRKKVDSSNGPKLIHTVRGVGYVMRE